MNTTGEWALCELVKGEVSLCLRQGKWLQVIREHMTPSEAVQMFKDVMTGKISPDELAATPWRTVRIDEAGFVGAERMELPPVKDWKK